jgi:hypothetical protein
MLNACGSRRSRKARWLQQMVYAEDNAAIFMYGGATADKTFTDLWLLKDTTWKKLSDDGPALIKSAFAYDPGRKRVVLFGGSGDGGSVNETWEWDGNNWKQISVAAPPPEIILWRLMIKRTR